MILYYRAYYRLALIAYRDSLTRKVAGEATSAAWALCLARTSRERLRLLFI